MTTSTTYATAFHAPVLAQEVVELFRNARNVLDGTLGGGGHALALLERGASVTGLDRDPVAVTEASQRLAAYRDTGRFRAFRANFGDVDNVPELSGESFDAILLDLGVSTHQVDQEGRGFTFRQGAPLDMRMSADVPHTAAELINETDEGELARIFDEYGDAKSFARRLARQIVRRRENRPFQTSDDLVGAIRAVLGPRSGPSDFAPIFQAVRIAVNDELHQLASALPALRDRLVRGGILAVISYHSGEDRLVKRAFREWSASCICPPRQPVCSCRGRPLGETLTRKAMVASDSEVTTNPRARSAHLRAWRSAA
ncbi:MAG TPA: 16S rRNA (cytosine(1402)-N(4))-methyltransferase RsmH [Burkholderiales bacterium]|nr:16S rRNA (cytosine(1402)-N(4))-methyltransferase RsmH [Burkholderiales bacterium]